LLIEFTNIVTILLKGVESKATGESKLDDSPDYWSTNSTYSLTPVGWKALILPFDT